MGLGENKYGTRNGVINLRAVKHALNVYFREFSRPVFRASPPNRRRNLEFDYEIQFERNDGSETLIFILMFRFVPTRVSVHFGNNATHDPLRQ